MAVGKYLLECCNNYLNLSIRKYSQGNNFPTVGGNENQLIQATNRYNPASMTDRGAECGY